MLRVSAILLALLACLPATAPAATPAMVRDLDPRLHTPGGGGTVPSQVARAGSRAVLVQQSSGFVGPSELWTTDGTAAGTERLRAFPGNQQILGSTGEVVLFATPILVNQAYTAPSLLWRTDGTRAGTFSLGTVMGFDPSDPLRPMPFSAIVLHGALLFSGCTPAWGCELWRSDGTPAGTRRLREIVPGTGGSAPRGFALLKDRAYFFADDPTGIALWQSDGTAQGTQRVLSLPPFSRPHPLFAQGSRLYFTEGVSSHSTPSGPVLWTSDGTSPGTRPVPPFDGRNGGPQVISPYAGLGDRAVFLGVQGKGDFQLWITDGAARSAHPLPHFDPLPPNGGNLLGTTNGRLLYTFGGRLWTSRGTLASSRPLDGCPGGCPANVAIWGGLPGPGGRLLFAGWSSAGGVSLWTTDGTGAGTRKQVDLCSSTCDSGPALAGFFLGKVFFSFKDQLWATDGSPEGTRPLADHPVTFFNYGPPPVFAAGDRVFFSAFSAATRTELWTTDGTPGGTSALAALEEGASSNPQGFFPFGRGGVLFFACDNQTAVPWSSDGTRDGTRALPGAAACPQPGSLDPPPHFLRIGEAAFFTGWTDDNVSRIWRTDGTPEGTTILFRPGADESLGEVAAFRGKLFFTTSTDAETRFWTSDGTAGGTSRLFSLPLRYANGFAAAGDLLFFLAEDADFRIHDWVTDGTAAGTHLFLDVLGSPLLPFLPFRGAFYFLGDGLWKTDGTPDGTVKVVPNDASPDLVFNMTTLVPFAGSLFFIAQTGSASGDQPAPYALFRSDGTALGTSRIKLLGVDPKYPSSTLAVVAGSFLYFVAGEAEHGQEVWRSDGTAAGTVLVSDIAPGAPSSDPQELTAAGDRLYFTADDGEHGRELWVTRGVPGDARPVGRRTDGTLSLSPRGLTVSGDRLFFSADDGVNGREPWLLPLTPEDP